MLVLPVSPGGGGVGGGGTSGRRLDSAPREGRCGGRSPAARGSSVGAGRVRESTAVLPPFSCAGAFWDRYPTGATLTSPSIRSYGETLRAGAVVSSHRIVADLGAGTPRCTFIFI